MASQSVSLSHLLQAQSQGTSLNIAPLLLLNQLSSTPQFSSLAGLPHMPQADAQRASLQASLLNQLSSNAPPLSSLTGSPRHNMPQVQQAQRTSLDASLLNQLGSPPPLSLLADQAQAQKATSPPSSLPASLIELLQLAPLAQQNNVAGLSHVPQAPTVPSTHHTTMLEQLTAAQANQSSYSPPNQSTAALTNANWLQRLSASQNPSFP
eukprot:CAMPEP_0201929926 /NCGR_PEP_ID=MMETSP0903-20130614/24082_1 /ASSEMBLY_ACC=CAM_ASM_000552 /TAXON_ID=420261 /ORGANISM="Thalassiosira antarctica, Strain CCMP982" /LENGTH=208 /DNA_ID=CAMNT_0048468853 /DNA_START=113 /DNA_END=735 /DNA_ORIENTATION=+